MRGKLGVRDDDLWRRRNIPAYAGKTQRRRCDRLCPSEHPRVCGENSNSPASMVISIGTSPRMRGKQGESQILTHFLRNIPAYAGKTPPPPNPRRCWSEHPRVCGENLGGLGDLVRGGGTSPRMRGKQVDALVRYGYPRNIPAYAGKTRSVLPSWPE